MELNEINKIIRKILNEELDKSRIDIVKSAYNQIISAVKGLGTDTEKVYNAVKKLKDGKDFKYLTELFKDGRTGYSKFSQMINSEYDAFNIADVKKLYNYLKSIGVNTTYNINNLGGFYGDFKIKDYGPTETNCKVYKDCKSLWQKELPKAVKYWKDWLSNPVTKKKVKANWDAWYLSGEFSLAHFFPIYMDVLDNLKLKFYNCKYSEIDGTFADPTAFAFVQKGNNEFIYVNCSKDDNDKLGSLIHEIQHIIYNIKPLNPEKKLSNIFVKPNSKKETTHSISNSLVSSKALTNSNFDKDVLNVAKSLNTDPEIIDAWKKAVKEQIQKGNKNYLCENTEKMSNIMSIRKLFNIKPGEKLTLQMLRPYIILDKHHTDIYWFLICWASKGFPNINKIIQKTNDLAAQGLKNPDDVA